MPLLPQEPSCYPEDLFAAAEESGWWWVLHTRPRTEKKLARHLHARRISYFLPIHERRQLIQGRLRTSYLPLFAGYLFLRGDHENRVQALESNLVAHCLEVADQRQLITDLTGIQRLLQSEAVLTPEQRFPPGAPVEIVAGPFAGLLGKIERQRGNQLKFFVEVRLLQQGVSVEIDSWMIEPAASQGLTSRLVSV